MRQRVLLCLSWPVWIWLGGSSALRAEEPPPPVPDASKPHADPAALLEAVHAKIEFHDPQLEMERQLTNTRNEPGNENHWARLGWAQLSAGDAAAAEKSARTALRIRPYHARHLLLLAYTLLAQDKPAQIPELLGRMLQCNVVPLNNVLPRDLMDFVNTIKDDDQRETLNARIKEQAGIDQFAMPKSRTQILADATRDARARFTLRDPLNKLRLWIFLEKKFAVVYDEEVQRFEDLAKQAPEAQRSATISTALLLTKEFYVLAEGVLLRCARGEAKWSPIAPPEAAHGAPCKELAALDAGHARAQFGAETYSLDYATQAWTREADGPAPLQILEADPGALAFAKARLGKLDALNAAQAAALLAQWQDLQAYLKENAPKIDPATFVNTDGRLSIDALRNLASKHGAPEPAALAAFRGMTLASWHEDDFTRPEFPTALTDLKALGAGWVAIVNTGYQDGPYSTDIHADLEKTAPLETVEAAVKQAHAAGLKVLLKIHVNLEVEEKDDYIWRGMIGPRNEKEAAGWFFSYTRFLMDYVDIAKRQKVELLTLGVELRGLSGHPKEWRTLAAAVRERGYTGKLTFAGLYNDLGSIKFWDALDFIAVDAYNPIARNKDATLAHTLDGWKRLDHEFSELSRRNNKKIIFTEIGYNNLAGCAERPWFWAGAGTRLNNLEQAACYHAALSVAAQAPWCEGMFWWTWDLTAPGPRAPSYSPQSKLALLILESYYRAPVQAPPRPPAEKPDPPQPAPQAPAPSAAPSAPSVEPPAPTAR